MSQLRPSLYVMAALASTGIAAGQIQRPKVHASDLGTGEEFGRSVDIDGSWAIVASPFRRWNVTHFGAVYFYEQLGKDWVERQIITPSTAEFGDDLANWSISIDGSLAIAGAMSSFIPGPQAAGVAYVFERSGQSWSEVARIQAADPSANAFFGYAVAVSGDRLIVGAREDSSQVFAAGSAYIFDRVGTGWVQTAKLTASDQAMFDFFGQVVDIHGDFAIVGSSADLPGGSNQGAAYVFQRFGSSWTEVAKLTASDPVHFDGFGSCVGIGPDIAVVSAPLHNHGISDAGALYAFERINGQWIQTQEFFAADRRPSQRLGQRLDLEGDMLIAGATGDGLTPAGPAGAAHVFRRSASGWASIGKCLATDGEYGDSPAAVSVFGDVALMGALGDDDACPTNPVCNSGAIYFFDLAPDARQYGHCAANAPCGNVDSHGGCLNSTGFGATFAAAGSTSVVLDELELEVRNMQPSKSAFVFMAAGQGQAILGDGLRVAAANGSGFYRFPLRQSSLDGSFIQGPGLIAHSQNFNASGHIQPGGTWNFQCWYRDPAGPCAQGTNLTNGVEVDFLP